MLSIGLIVIFVYFAWPDTVKLFDSEVLQVQLHLEPSQKERLTQTPPMSNRRAFGTFWGAIVTYGYGIML